ncbi:response regulator [Janibacter sp. G56]|uniref:response regulator n=1 Tax=Janibacter sp. G56 TaxID=3418717 RepID=UPI003D08F1C6
MDDSPIVRTGLRSLLEAEPDIEVVGEAGDGDEGLAHCAALAPDVVLLDVRMPRRDGVSVVEEMSGLATVVMMTFTDEASVIQTALRRGASGYLVHGTFDADSLAAMVRQCAAGSGAFSGPALAALRGVGEASTVQAAAVVQASGSRLLETFGLSPRQVEVMDLIAHGRTNGQIAKELFLAEKTVKNHINAILPALGVTTRAEAIVRWLGRS